MVGSQLLFILLHVLIVSSSAFNLGHTDKSPLGRRCETFGWRSRREVVSLRTGGNHGKQRSSLAAATDGSGNSDPLSLALAKLDREGKLQKRQSARWRTILLDNNDNNNNQDESKQQRVYVLEPSYTPSCTIHFWGGAGLASYASTVYNEFLLRLSDSLQARVVTCPYSVGLDHFAIAQQVGEAMRRVTVDGDGGEDAVPTQPVLPTYSLAHSLGAKLSTIYTSATNPDYYAGTGLIGFNNFSFSDTVGMAREVAEQIQSAMGRNNGAGGIQQTKDMSGDNDWLAQVFAVAETAVAAVGIDFSPTAEQMDRLIALKYSSAWRKKTRLFVFDDDTLQNSAEFCEACSGPVDVSALPGQHLTPVYLTLGLDQIPDEEAQAMAREATGGVERATFGNEEELSTLVGEVSDWIMGKDPSRRPDWQEKNLLEASESQ